MAGKAPPSVAELVQGFLDGEHEVYHLDSVPEAKRLKDLEAENGRLKKLLAEQLLENEVIKDALRKNGERTGPARAGALFG
ncbi:hypothetical protein GCM10009552_33770 [Rothia nasimurium]